MVLMNAKTMHRLKDRQGGITMAELVICLLILGILTGIAVPGILGGIQRTGVDGASRQLANDIRLAQASAPARALKVKVGKLLE